MGSKKGTVNNMDFLNQLTTTSKSAAQNVTKAIGKIGVDAPQEKENEGKKKIEYVDVFQMEPAPTDWNRYPLLKEGQHDKYLELKLSIYEKGIEDPLVIWEQPGGKYMILAGHNRREACIDILNECRDEKGFNEEKYRLAPAIIYLEKELNEQGAKEIIDDTNLYRDFSKLPEQIKMQILSDRAELYKKRRYAKGERIDQLAKDFGLKRTTIYETMSLNEQLVEPFRQMYFDGKLKKKSALRLTSCFDKDKQQWIFDEYSNQIDDAKVASLKKNMTKEEIDEVFRTEAKTVKKITVDVPTDRVAEFREMFQKWLIKE